MEYNKEYLYNAYNATSTGDENGELETYENWLERQLLSRLRKLDMLQKCTCNDTEMWNLITGICCRCNRQNT